MIKQLKKEYKDGKVVKLFLTNGDNVEGVIKSFNTNSIMVKNNNNESIRLYDKIIGGWKFIKNKDEKKDRNSPVEIEELNVKRLNLVEEDGTVRMVITNKQKMPGLIYKNKEYKHPRAVTGILFYNEEGTECGGLIYTGEMDKDGNYKAAMHLSFDEYNEDQVLYFNYQDENGKNSKLINIQDNKSEESSIKHFIEYKKILNEEGKDKAENYKKEHFSKITRPFRYKAGVDKEGNSINYFYDKKGNKKISIKVDEDENPKIEFFDENGKVIYSIP